MHQFSASGAMRAAWHIFIQRPWFLIGGSLVIALIAWSIGFVSSVVGALTGANIAGGIAQLLISVIGQVVLGMGTVAFYLGAHDHVENAKISMLWHPKYFWRYAGVALVMSLVIIATFVALVAIGSPMIVSMSGAGWLGTVLVLVVLAIPALIPIVLLMLAPYFVIDRGSSVTEAITAAVSAARSHFWQLAALLVFIVLINILGVIALFVGVFVSSVLSGIAMAHAYRVLTRVDHVKRAHV